MNISNDNLTASSTYNPQETTGYYNALIAIIKFCKNNVDKEGKIDVVELIKVIKDTGDDIVESLIRVN